MEFTSHSSEGWKSKNRVPAWLGEDPLLGHRFLVVSSHGGVGEGAPWSLSFKGTNPIPGASTLMT